MPSLIVRMLLEIATHVLDISKDLACTFEGDLACIVQDSTVARPDKELLTKFFLERTDSSADRGLRDMEPLGCLRHGPAFCDSDKLTKLLEFHGSSSVCI